jgi:hypothetical protein
MMQIATKISGEQISDKMCVWTRKFWKCSKKPRTFEISRTSEKLLSNIASSNTHLEYEERERARSA